MDLNGLFSLHACSIRSAERLPAWGRGASSPVVFLMQSCKTTELIFTGDLFTTNCRVLEKKKQLKEKLLWSGLKR